METTGIDIAHHQLSGPFDWTKLPATVRWAYIRTTYGVRLDREFEKHFAEARETAPHIALSSYHFFRQQQAAKEQWVAWRDAMDRVDIREGAPAPALDLEWNEQFDGPVDPRLHNTRGRELAERIRDEFGACIIYLAPGFFQRLGEPAWLLDFPWWVAHYTSQPEPWVPWKSWALWQFGTFKTDAYSDPIDGNRTRELVLATKSPSWELDEVAPLPPNHGSPQPKPPPPPGRPSYKNPAAQAVAAVADAEFEHAKSLYDRAHAIERGSDQ